MSDSEPNVPYGYCHCGCGGKTPLAPRNRAWLGHVKGEPVPYVPGHNSRRRYPPPGMPRTKLCDCGCGEPAPIAKFTIPSKGHYRGYPIRFINGHGSRRIGPIESFHPEDRGHETPCWIWDYHVDEQGYGRVSLNGRYVRAHRAVYEQRVGAIPEGLQLDHLCRVTNCVNPAHLEPVTGTENIRRSSVAKLTLEKVRAMRAQAAQGVSRSALARQYGVSVTHACRVVDGKVWREE